MKVHSDCRAERKLNDTEMVRGKSPPALQPPAPPSLSGATTHSFRSPPPPTNCQLHATPSPHRDDYLSLVMYGMTEARRSSLGSQACIGTWLTT